MMNLYTKRIVKDFKKWRCNDYMHARLYPQRYGFGPRRMFRASRVVGHANAERTSDAIRGQQIFTRSLKTEEFPVVRPVVRIAKHRADAVH